MWFYETGFVNKQTLAPAFIADIEEVSTWLVGWLFHVMSS